MKAKSSTPCIVWVRVDTRATFLIWHFLFRNGSLVSKSILLHYLLPQTLCTTKRFLQLLSLQRFPSKPKNNDVRMCLKCTKAVAYIKIPGRQDRAALPYYHKSSHQLPERSQPDYARICLWEIRVRIWLVPSLPRKHLVLAKLLKDPHLDSTSSTLQGRSVEQRSALSATPRAGGGHKSAVETVFIWLVVNITFLAVTFLLDLLHIRFLIGPQYKWSYFISGYLF